MADKAAAMSVQNGTAIIVHVFNLTEHHQTDLALRIKVIKDSNIFLREGSLSHVTSFRA